jgi:hypothetical protein
MKVGENQPSLFGVDVIHALGMDLLLSEMKFSITMKQPPFFFKHINLAGLMHSLKITTDQLKPITQLPPIIDVVQKMFDTGTAYYALDLGTTNNMYIPAIHRQIKQFP